MKRKNHFAAFSYALLMFKYKGAQFIFTKAHVNPECLTLVFLPVRLMNTLNAKLILVTNEFGYHYRVTQAGYEKTAPKVSEIPTAY